MEYENIPGSTEQYYETIDMRCNIQIIKKQIIDVSDVKKYARNNMTPETTMTNNLHQHIVVGKRSQDKNQEPIEPTITSDNTDEKDDDNDEDKKTPKSDHLETFLKIDKLNFAFAWFVGLGVHETWTYHNGTRWTKFMLVFGTIITIYSHLVVISEPAKLIEVFCIFGIVVPAFLKFELFVKSWREALSANKFLENIFERNADGLKALVLKKHIDESFTSIKIFLIIETVGLFIFACYPVYGFLANNELILIMQMQFPFLDQNTTFGFIVANLLMLKMGVWAYFGSVGFDLYLARLIYNYAALVKLVKQDLLDYVDMCKKGSEYSDQCKNAFLRNMFMKCQDKDRYIQFINRIFADIIFKQFCTWYVCLIFTLYAIIRNSWYSGYGFLIFILTEMYVLCILGTTIKTENDSLCFAIYDMPWYDYPISKQKELTLLLHSSQNAMELWIGPFAPLNVESGLELTKSIYSTSTMIMNTSE